MGRDALPRAGEAREGCTRHRRRVAPDRTRAFAAIVLIGAAAGAVPTALAQSSTTSTQFWPEIQIHLGLDPKTKIILLGNLARDRETNRNLEGQLGINIDHKLTDYFSIRAGYRFGGALGDEEPYTEHRILLEQTFQFALPHAFQLSMRTREDLRFVNQSFSARFRERATIERNFKIDGITLAPYASAEIFYDTRHDRFSRHRFAIGTVLPVTKWLALDAYASRQTDTHPQRKHVNAFGITIVLTH